MKGLIEFLIGVTKIKYNIRGYSDKEVLDLIKKEINK